MISATYFPTKFSKTDDFPADCPPTTAICGRSMTIGTPSLVKASCIRLMIGIKLSIPWLPDMISLNKNYQNDEKFRVRQQPVVGSDKNWNQLQTPGFLSSSLFVSLLMYFQFPINSPLNQKLTLIYMTNKKTPNKSRRQPQPNCGS